MHLCAFVCLFWTIIFTPHPPIVSRTDFEVFDDTTNGICSCVILVFLYEDKTHQRPSHISAECTVSDQHNEPFTEVCGAKEKRSKWLWGIDRTELFFNRSWVTEHREVLEDTGGQTRENLIYLWLFDVFFQILSFYPRALLRVEMEILWRLATQVTQKENVLETLFGYLIKLEAASPIHAHSFVTVY